MRRASSTTARPRLIAGGLHSDSRGTVAHVNGFDFRGVERFYTIRSRAPEVLRGWTGHRRDHKWFTSVQGDVLVAVVEPDDWVAPSQELPVATFELTATAPSVLHVPAGFATAIMHLTQDALLLVFSSGRMETASEDDFRYPEDQWRFERPEGDTCAS